MATAGGPRRILGRLGRLGRASDTDIMITRIEALNYRCLRYVRQSLDRFHVLVGPNASGKTTFLDVVSFLGRLVSDGLEEAVAERTRNFQDLLWQRTGDSFELAVEVRIPDHLRAKLPGRSFNTIRYEVRLGILEEKDRLAILAEKALLKETPGRIVEQRTFFPIEATAPKTILTGGRQQRVRGVVTKVPGGNDNFYSEVHEKPGKGWAPSFKLGPFKPALRNLPADEKQFPVCSWLKELLSEGIQSLVLNGALMRKASPPGQGRTFRPDGSNLPWVISELARNHPDRFAHWIAHVRTALPDIHGIRTIERPDDKHSYLMISYEGGTEVPSWVASDGTLRLLALTLPAYLPDVGGVYLIEEPENGIHPRAVEAAYQSSRHKCTVNFPMAGFSPPELTDWDPGMPYSGDGGGRDGRQLT